MTRKSLIAAALICGGCVLGAPGAAAGASLRAPRPDPSFGAGKGWVTTSVPGTTATVAGIAVLPGGGIVTAGETTQQSGTGNGQILVVRYLANGRLDRSFGSRGIFRSALPAAAGPFLATSVVRDRSTGKLLVAGGSGMGSMLVIRLTAAGRLDRTFGRGHTGYATVAAGGIAQSIVLQPNGGILLGGSNANVNGEPMVVARLTRSGVPDRRFGRGGLSQFLFWNPLLAVASSISGLALVPGGGIIGFGHLDYIGGDGHGTAGVFELSANGRLRQSFGTNGHVEVTFPSGGGKMPFAQWFPCGMTVDSRGRATITGGGLTSTSWDLLTARLTPGGTLDRSYGPSGTGRSVIAPLEAPNDTICGAIATAGGTLTFGAGPALVQLLPRGTANPSFGRGGTLTVGSPRNVGINALASWSSSRILLAGSAGNSAYVARYSLR